MSTGPLCFSQHQNLFSTLAILWVKIYMWSIKIIRNAYPDYLYLLIIASHSQHYTGETHFSDVEI